MMLRSLLPLCSVLAFTLGCGARTSAAPTVNLQSGARVTSADNQDRGEILLWATKGEGEARQTRTFRLAAEGSLTVLHEHDGILIATSHGELKWQAQEIEVKLAGCDMEGGPGMPTKGSATTANLVNSTGNIVYKVVESDGEGGELDDLQHHVELLGTIGPYLFIHEVSYMNGCGPHGNTMASAMIWDADSGKTIDLWSELPAKDKLAETARRKLIEEEPEPGQEEESNKPEPAQFVPAYGERGALRLDAQFTQSACYACSDGQWSSYTRSAIVPTDWIPERMRAWVTPPVVVKDFLEAHRDWHLGGWSKR